MGLDKAKRADTAQHTHAAFELEVHLDADEGPLTFVGRANRSRRTPSVSISMLRLRACVFVFLALERRQREEGRAVGGPGRRPVHEAQRVVPSIEQRLVRGGKAMVSVMVMVALCIW